MSGKKKFEININENVLMGYVYTPNRKSKKATIFLTGSGGTQDRLVELGQHLAGINYLCLTFDYRGRGESKTANTPRLKAQIKDTKAVIDYLSANFPYVEEVSLVATSMGGHVASCVANYSDKIKELVLVAPAAYNKKMEELPYTKARVSSFSKDDASDARSFKEIEKFKGKLHLVYLTEDKIIPNWVIDEYRDRAERAKELETYEIHFEHAILRYPKGRDKLRKLFDKILK